MRRGAARFQEWSPELVTLGNYYHVLTADDDDESYADDEDFTVDNSTSTHAAASTPLLLTDTIIATTATTAAVSSSTNDDDWEIFITEASDSSDETAQTTEADEESADGDDGTYDDLPELRVIEPSQGTLPSQGTSPSLSETLQVAAAATLSSSAGVIQANEPALPSESRPSADLFFSTMSNVLHESKDFGVGQVDTTLEGIISATLNRLKYEDKNENIHFVVPSIESIERQLFAMSQFDVGSSSAVSSSPNESMPPIEAASASSDTADTAGESLASNRGVLHFRLFIKLTSLLPQPRQAQASRFIRD